MPLSVLCESIALQLGSSLLGICLPSTCSMYDQVCGPGWRSEVCAAGRLGCNWPVLGFTGATSTAKGSVLED